jgi:hypothetical protein
VPYEAIMAGDRGLERWLEAVETYGFCPPRACRRRPRTP